MGLKKFSILVLSIMILLVFIASASAADSNDADAISIDESANNINEEIALDSSLDDAVSNGNKVLENEENGLLSDGNDGSLATGDDSEILSDDVGNFSQLAAEVSQSGPVTLKHKTYVYDKGDVIYISEEGKVIDGNGAVIDMSGAYTRIFYVKASGVTIKNLTIKNTNQYYSGAIIFAGTSDNPTSGNVINCNFINDTSESLEGGAIWMEYGNVINCTFTNNSATGGGAVFIKWGGNVTNCSFVNNRAISDAGGAAYLNMANVTNCNFTNNTAPDGGAFNMNYGSIVNCSFSGNRANYGGAVWLERVNVINCSFADNIASSMATVYLYSGNVTNCNFTNNKGHSNGGGLWMNDGRVEYCNFTNNTAYEGGGVCFADNGKVLNSNFINNSASFGGAVKMAKGEVTNSNFTNNTSDYGSALYFSEFNADDRVSNSVFLDNRAKLDDDNPFNVIINGNHTEITLKAKNNYINAIITESVINFTNVTYWGAGGITNTDSSTPIMSKNQPGQNITVIGVFNGNVVNTTKVTDENGKIVLNNTGDYWIIISHKGDSYYTGIEKIFTNMELYANVTSVATNNKTVNITAKSNIFNEGMPGQLLFIFANGLNITASYSGNGTWWAEHTFDDYGIYPVNASYIGIDNVKINNGTINITKADSTISLDDIVLTYGDLLNVTVETEGATGITAKLDGVDVSVDNYTIAISALSGGNYTLTVTTIPDEDHNAVSKAVNVMVNKMHTEIILTNESVDLRSYGTLADWVSLNPSIAGDLTFASSNETVAKVDDNGMITAWYKGTAIITVSYAGNENYTAAEKILTVNVLTNDVSLIVENTSVDLKVGEDFNIIATTDPVGVSIDYVSSNKLVAYVTDTGIIKASGEGTAIITVSVGDDRTITYNSTNITVTVSRIPTEIILTNETLDLKAFDTVSDFASITTGYPGDLTFASSNEDVAVLENGMIVAVGAGNANITVSYGGNNVYAPAENKTIQVTVTALDAKVNVTKTYYELLGFEQDEIIAFTAPDGLEVKYYTNDDDVVFVYNGKITALGEGLATIFVSVGDNITYKYDVVEVKVKVSKNPVQIVSNSISTVYGKNDYLTIYLKDSNGNPVRNAKVTVDLNGAKNYTTDANGTIKVPTSALSVGTYAVNITYAGNETYGQANATANVTVVKDQSKISAAAVKATYDVKKNLVIKLTDSRGNALKGFKITVALNGSKTYTTNSKGQVTINVAKLMPKTYTAKISFKGNGNYLNSVKSVKVTVIKATPKLTAKAKTFKVKVKTKKYTVSLKNNRGKVMKKVKLTLKVNKKTFRATTNSKGVATFKITNLKKRGKFTAVIRYAGNKYYKALSKKAKITVKK